MEGSLSQRDRRFRASKALRAAGRWFTHLFATIGLIVVLVTITPVVGWWAHAYSGSVDQPKGDVLIVLSAARTITAYSLFLLTGGLATRYSPGKMAAFRRSSSAEAAAREFPISLSPKGFRARTSSLSGSRRARAKTALIRLA